MTDGYIDHDITATLWVDSVIRLTRILTRLARLIPERQRVKNNLEHTTDRVIWLPFQLCQGGEWVGLAARSTKNAFKA